MTVLSSPLPLLHFFEYLFLSLVLLRRPNIIIRKRFYIEYLKIHDMMSIHMMYGTRSNNKHWKCKAARSNILVTLDNPEMNRLQPEVAQVMDATSTWEWVVKGGLYSPPGIPRGSRGMAQIPQNSAESADPRIPFFWCIVTSPFRTDPRGSAQNDAESGSFSHGSVEFTRTFPC